MKIACFVLFAQLGCIFAFSVKDSDIYNEHNVYDYDSFGLDPDNMEPNEYLGVIQMLQEAKKLSHGKFDREKNFWKRKFGRDIYEGRRGERPGVDYFRPETEDPFPSTNLGGGDRWFEHGFDLGEAAQPVKREAPGPKGPGAVPGPQGPPSPGGLQQVKAEGIGEELILALIVKSEYKDDGNCKTALEKYCDGLNETDPNLQKVNEKVKEFCGNGKPEGKCKGLKDKVEKKVGEFKQELEDALKKADDEKNCKELEEKCIFLENVGDDDLKKKCSELRSKCYKKKREEVTYEVLSRGLKVVGSDANKCDEKKIQEVCQKLSGHSDELMLACLDPSATCNNLKSTVTNVCRPLETELKNVSKEECHKMLEDSYFYESSCANTKCTDIKNQCKGKGFTYTAPGSDFSLVEREPGFEEKIGLEEVLTRAEADGVLVGTPGYKTLKDLIL
ncbi:hypothetical protein MERGE_003037, partial [Pneumocystis wakefieldiae]